MPPKFQPVSEDDKLKLLAAYCLTLGDVDKVAEYMEITKNAFGKRFRSLVAATKEDMTKKGLLDGVASPKKRAAEETKPEEPKKKAKKANGIAKEEDESGEETKPKLEKSDEGADASDEVDAGSDGA